MKRMLPPSRIEPMADASYFERVMGIHFRSVNTQGTRSSFAGQAIGYAAVIFLLLVTLGIFGDLAW